LASGRITRTGGSATINPRDARRKVVLTCVHEGNGGDPPVAIVWDLAVKSQPDRRIPFRLENIPLPNAPNAGAAPKTEGARKVEALDAVPGARNGTLS